MTARVLLTVLVAIAGACSAPATQRRLLPDPLATVSAQELFDAGLAFDRAGDSIRAEQYLAAALNHGHPARVVVPHLLAVCVRAERYAAAIQHARRHLRRHPDDWAARFMLAHVYAARGDVVAARAQVRRVLDARPNAPRVYLLMGELARDVLFDPDLAAACFAAGSAP